MEVKDILSKIKKEASARCKSMGESRERLTKLIRFINGITLHYSRVLGISQVEILKSLEKNRTYYVWNYYQKANFPRIKRIDVFETRDKFISKFRSGKFKCSHCGKITNSTTKCNHCGYSLHGLFAFGKDYKFIIKNEFIKKPIVYRIFPPIELRKQS